jgi:hypothetical protein
MLRTRTMALFFAFVAVSAPGHPQCLNYEPSIVQLTGIMKRITYPGRPNYESIEAGDEPDTGWYLILKHPICTNEKATDDNYPALTNESKIQLVVRAAQYGEYRHFVNSTVAVEGSLFAASTGHHHTNLLLQVTSIKRAPSRGDPTLCSGLVSSWSRPGVVACCGISDRYSERTRLQFPPASR